MNIAKGEGGRVYQAYEEQRQRHRDGKQDPLLACFGMGDGEEENGREGEYCNERNDEECKADFGQSLRFVTTGVAVIIARVDTANDTQDDAHGVEDFSKLYMSCGDERLVSLVDVRLDPTE